ncbi:MAG: class I SAM-dependent methyltransferase [Deltaproteobacteria bacterium]|nr:MAG: class I SAM-dependent methyltransferase [Deltaproteobacteria bacterium]
MHPAAVGGGRRSLSQPVHPLLPTAASPPLGGGACPRLVADRRPVRDGRDQAVMKTSSAVGERTIHDFGEQWVHYGDNDGFYGSTELFADVIGPLLSREDFAGRRVAEIGSGAGRIVAMMLECGAAHVVAVEPSDGYFVAQRNLARYGDRVTFLHGRGEDIPRDPPFDLIVSVGVLQFIPDPSPPSGPPGSSSSGSAPGKEPPSIAGSCMRCA